MKNLIHTIICTTLCFVGILGQAVAQDGLKKGNNSLLLSSDLELLGEGIDFRPGLGIGYAYFAEKYNFRTVFQYGQISTEARNMQLGEFRFDMKIEYDRYINNCFSLGAFMGPNFHYYEEWNGSNGPENFSIVEYTLGFGLSPKIYHLKEKYYLSLGLDLPLAEFGFFQADGPDPDISNLGNFRDGLDGVLFGKEVRLVATIAYLF